MDKGQEQFLNFILERTQETKIEEAKALLADNFRKQADGSYTQADALGVIPKLISFLKPEKVQEVQEVMKQFAQDMNR